MWGDRRNALALKSLAERFSPTELDRLDPAKRDEWKALLRSKASAVAGDVRSLESQLAALGLGSGSPPYEGGVAAASADGVVLSEAAGYGGSFPFTEENIELVVKAFTDVTTCG